MVLLLLSYNIYCTICSLNSIYNGDAHNKRKAQDNLHLKKKKKNNNNSSISSFQELWKGSCSFKYTEGIQLKNFYFCYRPCFTAFICK